MKRVFFIGLVTLISAFSVFSQNSNETLITVGNETVTRNEFERFYLKNNQMVSDVDKKSLDEYLDLFIIYKLKVAEAKANGIDKTSEFQTELDSYRKQLIQPYMVDTKTEDRLINEAYERLKYEINASHILILVPKDATPEDTLTLYNKTLQIRDRIIDGEPFETVARATSDDASVNRNGGNLGYFTAFQMVYPFEEAAYNLEIGNVSMPIKTSYGYHIIQLNDKRPTIGQVKVAHIMIMNPKDATEEQMAETKAKAESIYNLVLQNEDFAELAKKHSQDPGSARNGGELPWFGSGRMVPEFESAAFSLTNPGEITQPIQSQFGWHIIKLIDRKTIGSLNEMLPEIKTKLARDERGKLGKEVFVEKIKEKYGFEINADVLHTFYGLLDSSVYKGSWQMPSQYKNKKVFIFAKNDYTLGELGKRIESQKKAQRGIPLYTIAKNTFSNFVEDVVIAYEEKQLLENNLDFYYLLKEYNDGILLFEIMDQQVWSKAANDTEGIEKFYNENIERYTWEERVHAKLYKAVDEKTAKKAHKLAKSRRGMRYDDATFMSKFNNETDTLITIEPLVTLASSQQVKNHNNWNKYTSPVQKQDDIFTFIRVIKTVTNEPKSLNEIKGQVIADYQEHIEKKWLDELRKKHSVTINKVLYNDIGSNLN
ncbi:MAG: peptidylprolyl isomerase [Bacteroidales bacterium]|nr:peptidylprolyl isomerase [Bacteroidales bacterium]